MRWNCDRYWFDLTEPLIMGVLNVTPDSFSDGGSYAQKDIALTRAVKMVEEGAAIIDVGGESTRPGAKHISAEEEVRRVLPIVQALVETVDVPISVDTVKPEVMRVVIDAGAALINDVNALQAPGAIAAVRDSHVAVCLMHMQQTPQTMQNRPAYQHVTQEVEAFLRARLAHCENEGIARDRIVIDPGFGFGKTLAHNIALFQHLEQFTGVGVPVLVGVSRKQMLGDITGLPVEQRTTASVVAAVLAAHNGARILRVHDVKETRQGLQIAQALGTRSAGERM